MKTILQALMDEVHYPVGVGHLENRLLKRGLIPSDCCSVETLNSPEFIGAAADCLWFLISAPNFSEADKSFDLTFKAEILKQVNQLYKSIGESEMSLDKPMVYIEN
jgi:hypothetical protein